MDNTDMEETHSMKENCYSPAVDKLSEGLLKKYEPSLKNVENQLAELHSKQKKVANQIHEENISLARVQHSTEIQDMFKKITLYNSKLLIIKKQMRHIYKRSRKLKKRALKVQELKENEILAKEKKEQDLKREQELVGPGPSSSES